MRPGEKVETLRIHKPISEIAEDDIVAATVGTAAADAR